MRVFLSGCIFAFSAGFAQASVQSLSEVVTHFSEQKAPPACYIVGTVYNVKKRMTERRKADGHLGTLRFPLVKSHTECELEEHKFAVGDTPFTLYMRYRAPCDGWGHNYEGRLSDGIYNNLRYSKYQPLTEGGHNVFASAYMVSEGKTYDLSLTCF